MLTLMRRGLLLLVCGLAVTAPVASAQGDEVFVDPDSPSGKEYELPVNSARQRGAADAQQRDPAAAPLFGEGVDGDGASTSAPQRSRARAAASRATSKAAASDARSARASAELAAERKAQAAAPDGAGGLAAIVGVGAGVLLLGGLAGLFLRRRSAR
jgi:hypothetical protein